MASFAERLAAVRERIARAGRDPAEVAIVAVSKGRSVAECEQAIAAGLDLGENRVQEALPKLAALPDAGWHLVGHLQSNKVALVSGRFKLIQSLDSVRLAELLAAREPGQAILLQVNVSREAAKQGVDPGDAVAVARQMSGLLSLEGLMGIAPLVGDPDPAFRALADLRRRSQDATGRPLPILSMGMSGDYEAACRAGSTMLRLGRVLFDGN
ncbi:MAG: YggS family pyridoxal phosphate-dependent enzyme [Candidatus Dormibacteraeota bacterium]|nr:YggS family pyridoxal phosphate-dependent enzyme [Candidatus Dormibacteraeota bacterium]